MSYIMAVQTYRNGSKNFQWSMESEKPQDCWLELCESALLDGLLSGVEKRQFFDKPISPLSLAFNHVHDDKKEFTYIWLVATDHKPILEKVLIDWHRNDTKIPYWYKTPQIGYENIMANFYKRLSESYAVRLAEQAQQMDLLKDNIGNDESWNEGYEAGKHDGILIVSRELETSVAKRKAWRVNPHKGMEAWQSLYAEQLAVSESLKVRNSELHQLISALIETRPIHDGIRKEIISRLHAQAQQITMLRDELETYDGIDYSRVIELAMETDIDAWLNVANHTEKMSMIDTIKLAMANGGKVQS